MTFPANTIEACPCCSSTQLVEMYAIDRIPVHSCILALSAEEALAIPFGSLALSVCGACGFVFNTRYDSTLQNYTPAYEEQQTFSPTFNTFQEQLIDRLVADYSLRGKTALEIGCGKGDFLVQLCKRGEMQCIGIDPSADWQRLDPEVRERIRIIQEYFGPQHLSTDCDFLCCRHTLEHIGNTASFLSMVQHACQQRPDLPVFFEVPDALRVFREGAFWDVYYEHCSYFTPGSLIRFFRNAGFRSTKLALEYDAQYLTIEGAFRDSPEASFSNEESIDQTVANALSFADTARTQISEWQSKLERLTAKGAKIAIWGSGSKCVAFLFSLGMADAIDKIIDINPHRHGKFAPGLTTPIAAPESLRNEKLDLLVIMNPIYRKEIESMCRDLNCSIAAIETL